VTAAVLAGCGDSTVAIIPPAPTGAAATACQALDQKLPETVDGTKGSLTDPRSPYTAAWGDITLSCGGAAPTVSPTAQLVTVDDVDWYPEPLPQGGTRFTTVKRVATVSVSVPANRQPEADALVDVSPAVAATVPAAQVATDAA
jgi:hypothetical protein